jgi:folate/biopterin transporter
MGFLATLKKQHGSFFLGSLVCVYFGVKGFAAGLAGAAALPFFMNHLKVSAERFQAYSVAVMTPWSLKPAIGLLSDVLPIKGQHKVPYMLLAALVGTASFVGLAATTGCSAAVPAALLTGVSLEAAVVDLLAEGKYAEKMREHPESGGALPSFVWACLFAGALLAAVIAGPLADAGHLRAVFVLGVPAAAWVAVPLLLGWFPDPTVPPDRSCSKLLSNRNLAWLAGGMAVASVALTAITLQSPNNPRAKLAAAVGISAGLGIAAQRLLPPKIARCNLYMFLAAASHVSLVGALDYFYTAPKECVKDAPHFSMTFFVTWSQIAGAVASLAAVAIFQGCLQGWRLRPLFWVSTVVRCAAACVDLLIINRLNVAAGIPDEVAYMLGNNVAAAVAEQLDLMPAVVLTSKLCPPGMEATVYAVLAGFQNFGGSVSAAVGAALTTEFGVVADLESNTCSFDGLSALVLLCHVGLPLVVVPLTFILIPDATLKDPL